MKQGKNRDVKQRFFAGCSSSQETIQAWLFEEKRDWCAARVSAAELAFLTFLHKLKSRGEPASEGFNKSPPQGTKALRLRHTVTLEDGEKETMREEN